ncbi:MAG TPA: fumarylacetoacetate hydrolase family protein [Magnetospirillaceae bacterium]|jgi:2-oxo-3-hexenedioate decarboxylase/2-keto-4-pentenoate hydratase
MSTTLSDSGRIAAAAQIIAKARLANTPLDTLPDAIWPRDLAEGYRVQDQAHSLLTAAGRGAIVGHKIGATTPVMQDYMRIDHPCAGGIFATTVHQSGVTLPYSRFIKVGIECEVATRLGKDMPPQDAPYTRASVAPYVDAYMAAIELVDDRYKDWPSMGTPSLAADDFFGTGSVLGPPVAPQETPDLITIPGRAILNGTEVASGRGADVMGHPLEALAWLANHFAQRGASLRAGEFVSTGSLVKTIWLTPGDHIAIEIDGLGRVEVAVSRN